MVAKKAKKATRSKTRATKKGRVSRNAKIQRLPTTIVRKTLIEALKTVIPPSDIMRSSLSIEQISGGTHIGDLLVAYPRTREVLIKKGLRMEAEDAGYIYMTLDAFSALAGIDARGLTQEIIETARTPLAPAVAPAVVPTA